jgi:hypothetical protein
MISFILFEFLFSSCFVSHFAKSRKLDHIGLNQPQDLTHLAIVIVRADARRMLGDRFGPCVALLSGCTCG